jgi:DNA-binding NarL/FixJ family response regulator
LPHELRVAVLANRRVIGESVASAIRDHLGGPVAVGSTDPKQPAAFRRAPEVVLIVGSLTDGSTSAAVALARRRWRHATLIALADTDRVDDGMELVRLGADSWLSRSDGLIELRAVLDRVAAGERQLLPAEGQAFVGASVRAARGADARQTSRLSGRERQVLVCFARGLSRPEIAATLAIALPTLRTHVQNILRKLDVHSIHQATEVALREGLLPALDED